MDTRQRRRYERISLSMDLEVKDLSTGRTWRGRSIDLSRGGMGFFAERFLPKGTPIRIHLQVPWDGRHVTAQVGATVMWSRTEGDGGVMGSMFDIELSPLNQPVLCEIVDRGA